MIRQFNHHRGLICRVAQEQAKLTVDLADKLVAFEAKAQRQTHIMMGLSLLFAALKSPWWLGATLLMGAHATFEGWDAGRRVRRALATAAALDQLVVDIRFFKVPETANRAALHQQLRAWLVTYRDVAGPDLARVIAKNIFRTVPEELR